MIQTVVFRAEASNKLGLGHMFRCLNFARSIGIEISPYFVIRECPDMEKITRVLINKNWRVYPLSQELDLKTDAANTAEIARKHNAKLVVTDLCHRYSIEVPDSLITYHRLLKQRSEAFVLSIEDCRMAGFSSDAAVIWNSNDTQALEAAALDGCRILAGTRYFICDPKFSSFDRTQIRTRKTAGRILVCIGGSDPKRITLAVLKAIKKISTLEIKTRLITGNGMTICLKEEIERLIESEDNISIIRQTDSMVELLNWADVAVVGEGLLKYEAAITGTPSLIIPQFDFDSIPIVEFLKTGCSKCLKNAGENNITTALSELLTNYETRQLMSKNGINAFDGRGMERIHELVLKDLFKGHRK